MKLLLLIIIIALLSPLASAAELLVSSAVGAKSFVETAGKEFEKTRGIRVLFNFSSSGKIAKQIELGAPTDLFISASKFWIDYLLEKKLLLPSSVKPLAGTKLVLISPKSSGLRSILDARRIAVGDKYAPVGKYAIETLKGLGIYEKVRKRLVFAPNAKQVAVWVVTGNADAGIVYYSDYLKFKDNLRLVEVFPDSLHSPIKFWMGVVRSSRSLKLAEDFEDFMLSLSNELYEKFGFEKVGDDRDGFRP